MLIQRSGTQSGAALPTIDPNALPPGTWLRRWPPVGYGVAHDFIVASRGWAFENAGPGSTVRVWPTSEILRKPARVQIIDVPQSWTHAVGRLQVAEQKLGRPWQWTYNCQDFASEVVTGIPQSFQRDAVHAALLVVALVWVGGNAIGSFESF